jgi:glycosyltransferase involved in cell wall biosynthesis
MLKRLAIISTHPIQYNAPLFTLLAKRGNALIKVFYTWGEEVLQKKYDPSFGKNIEWDIPLLEGYDYLFIKNVAVDKGSHHFKGIDNPGLIRAVKDWQADAVLVYGWSFKSHLKSMRYFHGKIPVFFRGDSTFIGKRNGLKSFLRLVFLKWVYRHVDKALFVGTNNKEYYVKAGMKTNQLVFCPHSVDNCRFMQGKIDYKTMAVKWKKELNVGLLSTVFLYAGKIDDNKNVRLLIETFIKVPGNNYLIIAGNGILENELKNSFSDYKNIYFLPFQNQQTMPVLYRMADVFVLPSKSETWGVSINEAMACGKALLVSDSCGAAKDLVIEGVNGYTFRSENAEDMKGKMLDLIREKNDLVKMGKASLEIVQEWNYEKDCIAIESLLNN